MKQNQSLFQSQESLSEQKGVLTNQNVLFSYLFLCSFIFLPHSFFFSYSFISNTHKHTSSIILFIPFCIVQYLSLTSRLAVKPRVLAFSSSADVRWIKPYSRAPAELKHAFEHGWALFIPTILRWLYISVYRISSCEPWSGLEERDDLHNPLGIDDAIMAV